MPALRPICETFNKWNAAWLSQWMKITRGKRTTSSIILYKNQRLVGATYYTVKSYLHVSGVRASYADHFCQNAISVVFPEVQERSSTITCTRMISFFLNRIGHVILSNKQFQSVQHTTAAQPLQLWRSETCRLRTYSAKGHGRRACISRRTTRTTAATNYSIPPASVSCE